MASTDREVLRDLYRSTGGDTWHFNNNWNSRKDLSQWQGVQVDDRGRVVRLDLNSNNLQGICEAYSAAITCCSRAMSLTFTKILSTGSDTCIILHV